VVTYAQNATPVHEGFLDALQHYCKANKATLVVIPGRYHNPTSIWTQNAQHSDWWDSALVPYLFASRYKIGPLCIYGDISIQPTAERPLSGFEVFAGESSAVFGHPKIQLLTVATATRRPRLLVTTGAVTRPNYTDSKAGKKSEAHHVLGAAIIESDGKHFHLRQINALDNDGSFIDLDKQYTAKGVSVAPRALALVLGDVHVEKPDQRVLDATLYATDSIAATLKPERIIYHDILDFEARNHHHRDDPMDRYSRIMGHGTDNVEHELKRVVQFLNKTPKDSQAIVIASNHDDAFDRWLRSADPRCDPENARLFHRMWHKLLEAFDRDSCWTPALELYCRLEDHTRTRFIRRNEEYKVKDITCGFHGDKGINGARGTAAAYAKLGVKTIIGHHHSPSILDGCYTVGVTAALDHGYNYLPSSWLHSHCAVYANGKRSLIHVVPVSDKKADWHLASTKKKQ